MLIETTLYQPLRQPFGTVKAASAAKFVVAFGSAARRFSNSFGRRAVSCVKNSAWG